MKPASGRSVLVLSVVFILTTSILVERSQAIRVHTHAVPVLSDAHGFTRRLAKDGTVEPTSDKAAARAYKNMQNKPKKDKKSKYGMAMSNTAAVEGQLCATVTVPLMACSGRRRFYY